MALNTFLKENLEKLAQQFPQVQIKYAYNYSIATHIVELTPEKEYYFNEELDNAWIPVSIEFMETFPADSISFISSDSSLAIAKPELEWNKPIPEWDMLKMNEVFNDILHSSAQFELPKTFFWEETINTNMIIESIHTQYNPITNLAGMVTVQVFAEASDHFHFSKKKIEVGAAGNIQYTMAA